MQKIGEKQGIQIESFSLTLQYNNRQCTTTLLLQ